MLIIGDICPEIYFVYNRFIKSQIVDSQSCRSSVGSKSEYFWLNFPLLCVQERQS